MAPPAREMIIVGVGASALIAAVGQLGKTGEFPGPSVAVGGFASAILLAALAEVWPAGAGGIALLMLTTSTFVYGADAWAALARIVNR